MKYVLIAILALSATLLTAQKAVLNVSTVNGQEVLNVSDFRWIYVTPAGCNIQIGPETRIVSATIPFGQLQDSLGRNFALVTQRYFVGGTPSTRPALVSLRHIRNVITKGGYTTIQIREPNQEYTVTQSLQSILDLIQTPVGDGSGVTGGGVTGDTIYIINDGGVSPPDTFFIAIPGGSGGNGIFGVPDTVPAGMVATIDSGITFQGLQPTTFFNVDMDQGLYGTDYTQNDDTLKFRFYDLGSDSWIVVDANGIDIHSDGPDKIFLDGAVRVTDLVTDPATKLVGTDTDGDLSSLVIGANLSVSGDTLIGGGGADGNGIYTGSGIISTNPTHATLTSGGRFTMRYPSLQFALDIQDDAGAASYVSLYSKNGENTVVTDETGIRLGSSDGFLGGFLDYKYGVLTFNDPSFANSVGIELSNSSANYNLTLPTSDGNPSEVLTTDVSGVLSWTAPPSSTNLSFTGTSSPVTLNSSTGTDVNFKDSTGIIIKQVGQILTILNSLPDQTVSLTGGGITNVTGTYPNFTVTSTEVDGSTTNEIQNLGYTASTGALTISSGTGTTIPVMTSSLRGLTPDGDGAGTDEFLREDGTWAVPPGGTPAGANYQVQYYNGGVFGADANFNYDPTNDRLVVGTTTPTAAIHARSHSDAGVGIFKGENLSGNDVMTIFATGYWKFGDNETYPRFYQSATAGGAVSYTANGINANVTFSATGNEDGFSVFHPNHAATAGTKNALNVSGTFAPSSGSAIANSILVAPTINQTGTSSGVTRGIYINPTLTSAVDFTSLEVVGTTQTNHLQGRGSTPTITVNTTTCGSGATASVAGTDLGFEVTLNFGTGPSSSGGEMFKIDYALTQPGVTIPVFSAGDDAGFFSLLERAAGAYVANADNTDFELWAYGDISVFESITVKINFFVSSR